MSTEVFDSVKLSHLKKVVKHVERDLMSIDFSERGIDPDVSFEFLIGSLFPTVYKNIMDAMSKERTQAYIEGYNAAKEEMRNENQISE